jgi:hypothetical protein
MAILALVAGRERRRMGAKMAIMLIRFPQLAVPQFVNEAD